MPNAPRKPPLAERGRSRNSGGVTTSRAIVAASLLAAPLALGGCAPPPAAVMERFEVAVHLSPNGDADVLESMALRVKAPTTFERVVRPARAESLACVAASLDGAPVTGAAGGAGGFKARAGNGVEPEASADPGGEMVLSSERRSGEIADVEGVDPSSRDAGGFQASLAGLAGQITDVTLREGAESGHPGGDDGNGSQTIRPGCCQKIIYSRAQLEKATGTHFRLGPRTLCKRFRGRENTSQSLAASIVRPLFSRNSSCTFGAIGRLAV